MTSPSWMALRGVLAGSGPKDLRSGKGWRPTHSKTQSHAFRRRVGLQDLTPAPTGAASHPRGRPGTHHDRELPRPDADRMGHARTLPRRRYTRSPGHGPVRPWLNRGLRRHGGTAARDRSRRQPLPQWDVGEIFKAQRSAPPFATTVMSMLDALRTCDVIAASDLLHRPVRAPFCYGRCVDGIEWRRQVRPSHPGARKASRHMEVRMAARPRPTFSPVA